MDLDEVLRNLGDEAQVINHAPVAFCLAVAFAGLLIYGALRWRYHGRIEILSATLSLKDAEINDYKRQLGGATPDEAKAELEDLRSQLRALKPRRLSDHQRAIIKGTAGLHPGPITISYDQASNGALYAGDFGQVFSEAGWRVNALSRVGFVGPLAHGIGLAIKDESDPLVQTVFQALRQAGIGFDHWVGPIMGFGPVEIFITAVA